jgi:outer membrane protein TolC
MNFEEEASLARTRHADGLTSYLPVLSATIAIIDAQRDLTESTARVQTALAALYKALGDDGALPGPGGE